MRRLRFFLYSVFCLAIAACAREEPASPTYFESENPEALSAWGQFTVSDGVLSLNDRVTPYDLATPLFSDYALKLRTVWTPVGASATYRTDEAFDFPVGAVITKTFYYPEIDAADMAGSAAAYTVTYGPDPTVSNGVMPLAGLRLIETRLLVRREAGWAALPYVWNDEQTEATLQRTGAVRKMTMVRPDGEDGRDDAGGDREEFAYLVPNVNQCAGCHATNNTTREIKPIGPKARHLNKASTFHEGFNQLDYWLAAGLLAGDIDGEAAPQNAVWGDPSFSLDARARAYLDVNCSHCHNPVGPADTSGLDLEPDAAGPALGLCKSPIAAGGGSGGRLFDIVPGAPEESITVFRMETTDPAAMMPELGRALTHEEGVELISAWISGLDGACS